MSDPVRSNVDVEVRYAETDQMGVAHHANYLVWFEVARTRLCALSGIHYADIEKNGYLLMVTGAEVSYRRGVRYGDTVTVSCWIDRLGSRALGFSYEVRKGPDTMATGRTDHVWLETATGRPCRIPELVREPFQRLAAGYGP